MIHFDNVSFAYSGQNVLEKLSFTLSSEQTHILLGPSGSGKSTIIKLLFRLLNVDSGTVELESEPIENFSQKQLSLKFGYVPQDGLLYPHLRNQENILLPAIIAGKDKGKYLDRLGELCELVSLNKTLLTHYPSEMSGGQRQRVSIIRSLILDPPVLIFDEPMANLDPLLRSEIQSELKTIFRSLKKTVLMVTHDFKEAQVLGDNILVLNRGKIEQSGSFNEIYNFPKTAFVEKFLNSQKIEVY